MPLVEALQSFEHGGARRRFNRFTVSEPVARDLATRGLVRIIDDRPPQAAGTPLSASPAAPASPRTTAKKPGRGAAKAAGEPLL